MDTPTWAGRECNLELLGIPCFSYHAPAFDADTIAAFEDAVLRARAGGYRRWRLEAGSGGYSADFPAEWDDLRVIQEVGYYHGAALEAHPARGHAWTPVSGAGPHFEDRGEIPTGSFQWFRPWDVNNGGVTVHWPREWEGGVDLLAPDPAIQTELFTLTPPYAL